MTTAVSPSTETIAAHVRDAASRGTRLRIVGAGTWLDAGRPVESAEMLSLAAHTGISEYTPGDLTLTAKAGTTLREIRDAVSPHGQWLALDPSGSDEGTIGATIATASSGPLATRFGAPRDLALGLEFVNGLGATVRGGGRVVKNVAGFDLTRLLTGSWGTLGVITEVTVRLHARPEADVTLAVSSNDGPVDVAGVRSAVGRWPFVPLACEVVNDTLGRQIGVGGRAVLFRIGGNGEAVVAQRRAIAELGEPREMESSVWSALRAADADASTRLAAVAGARRRGLDVDRCDRDRRAVRRRPRERVARAGHRPMRDSVGRRVRRTDRGDARRSAIAHHRRTRSHETLESAAARAAGRSASIAHSRRIRSTAHPESRHPRLRVVTQSPAIARPSHPDCAIPGTPLAGQRAGLDACVHCGFCLQACPTYVTLEDENDSPRGRIVLMRSRLRRNSRYVERERANAHRPLPRLPRVRDRVPVRRAVRISARGNACDDRRTSAASARRARHSVDVRASEPARPRDVRRSRLAGHGSRSFAVARFPGESVSPWRC